MQKEQQKLMLSTEARAQLADAASMHGLTRSEVVERLVRYLGERTPNFIKRIAPKGE